MALFDSAFDTLVNLQQALDAFRTSGWLDEGPSGGGAYPPINIFRRGHDFAVIAEVPGVKKADLHVEVMDNTIRLSGTKSMASPENASMHRRERLAGRFDRSVTLPVEIDGNGLRAECHEGILVVFVPRAAHEKPKAITVN